MDFHARTVSVQMPPARVREILIGEQHVARIEGHEDFFKPHAVYLTWSEAGDGRLESSLSYFRSKNLCVFRVFADIEAEGQGSKVTLSSGHGPFSKLAMGAAWVLGFCMFIVGAIIPWLQSKAYSHHLRRMVEHTGDALERMSVSGG